MAENDETFDPNDLDSIDALLDEAEQTANEDVAGEASAEAQDSIDALLDEAEEVAGVENDTPEIVDDTSADTTVEQSEAAAILEQAESVESTKQNKDIKKQAVPDADDFLAKRAEAARSDQNQNMVAEDMEPIKKLIIIFGSVLTVLIVIAIAIGVWSALAASSSAMDEDTLMMIESMQLKSDENGEVALESGKAVESLAIKIDLLSSLLEGVSSDIAKIAAQATSGQQQDMIGAISGGHHPNKSEDTHAATNTAKIKQGAFDTVVLDKVVSVNGKIIRAKKRIDEINRRVKSIQKQHTALLHSVKAVEKQMLMQQAAIEAERAAEEEKLNESNRDYRYMNGDMYDQSVTDSYP
ncbi:MAG: hypothetical protein ISEC1_P0056 [Thiomicrorhabdus sp.]|nr:MAG: hypothetical protein ISEC1_P0056 [Thiomicrorhabdus sp.]